MKPKLICMTPVRNEAWCLDVFLKCTSLWADHIIIADQNSTDGSREIALKYSKVILIENNAEEYNEAKRQNLLITEARKIEGPKILFALDADEVLSANYINTNDWHKIINSKPKDVFWFQWAQLLSDHINCWLPENYFPWMFHDDGLEAYGNYSRNIHSMRIPYPIEEKQMYYVKDFKVMHLASLYPKRQQSKARFYQCVERLMNNNDAITLFRQYQLGKIKKIERFDRIWVEGYNEFGINIFGDLILNEKRFWFDDEVLNLIRRHGVNSFKDICIFDKEWLKTVNIDDPRNFGNKLIHQYLILSKDFSSIWAIKLIDRIFKKHILKG